MEHLYYITARASIDQISSKVVKGWPISSHIVALTHQILVLPYMWFILGDAEACFRLTAAYFASDLLLNTPFIDRVYALHHVASLCLLVGGPQLLSSDMIQVACRWLVVLEFGSSGISLTDLTGRFYALRFVVYVLTRILVVAHTIYTAVGNPATRVCCALSLPLIVHNVGVAKRMWNKF